MRKRDIRKERQTKELFKLCGHGSNLPEDDEQEPIEPDTRTPIGPLDCSQPNEDMQ